MGKKKKQKAEANKAAQHSSDVKNRKKEFSNVEKTILQSNIKMFLLIFLGLFLFTIIIHAFNLPEWLKTVSVYLPIIYGIILSPAIFYKNFKN